MIGIIFDCDGVLVDSEESHFNAWKAALALQGKEFSWDDYFPIIGNTTEKCASLLSEKFGLPSPSALLKDKRAIYQNMLENGMKPIEPAVNFARALFERKQELGIKLAVASAARKEGIMIHLRHLGLTDVFDVILSGQDDLADYKDPEGVNKPKPYIYLHAAKLLGLDPSDCVAFEDSHIGATAASTAGIFTIAVPNEFTKHHDFSMAHYQINSLSEMSLDDFRF